MRAPAPATPDDLAKLLPPSSGARCRTRRGRLQLQTRSRGPTSPNSRQVAAILRRRRTRCPKKQGRGPNLLSSTALPLPGGHCDATWPPHLGYEHTKLRSGCRHGCLGRSLMHSCRHIVAPSFLGLDQRGPAPPVVLPSLAMRLLGKC
ncbi:hypothetical protein BDA96_03G054600 [Sorghum bicolor]|uniref:Uncharacterized protein n=1 Tax=Sorghum bicolor TaxID=4558 RepID=A0A921ULW7_SORBI|nr:hypothetical protein BDA96_03G054600 [Sorghum bicolor]